jgi:alpha-ketoglutarate-dependent taurine dioxygenase
MSQRFATTLPTMELRDGTPAIWSALREHGAVVLKAAAASPDAFDLLTDQFADGFRIHQDPTRQRYNPADTTQSVTSGSDAIGLHAERAYLPGRPEVLFFCCLTPPTSGGETTLCDGAAIVDALAAHDVQRLDDMTLLWRSTLDRPRWQRMWHSEDEAETAARFHAALQRSGETTRTTHWFDADGTLHVEHLAPSLSLGRLSGRKAFANYLLLQADDPTGPHATQTTGDEVPGDLLRHAADAARDLTIDIAWQRGDVAIIDNTRSMHGRRAFAGGARQVLVRMGDARLPGER